MNKTLKFSLIGVLLMPIFASCNLSDGYNIDAIPAKESKSDKWGLLNPKGEMILEDEFENTPSMVIDGVFTVREGKDELYTVYRLEDKPVAIKNLDGLKSAGLYSEGLIPVAAKNERIKMYDKDGNCKFELEPVGNHEIDRCDAMFHDGMMSITLDNDKYGFIDTKGKVVIKPEYDGIYGSFSDGYAVVGKKKTNSKDSTEYMEVSVIDKKGKEQFKLKEEERFIGIHKDKVMVMNEERFSILNFKGEKVVKLPQKVKFVEDFNDKYIIFVSDDYKYGVLDSKGETIVRPKYRRVQMLSDGKKFVCVKEDKKGVDIVNNKGDIESTLDYEMCTYIEGFGILAGDENDIYVLDSSNFKPYINKGVYEVNAYNNDSVYSDYFSATACASAILENFGSDGWCAQNGVMLNAVASSIKPIKERGSSDFSTYNSYYSYDAYDGRKYNYDIDIEFTNPIVEDYYTTEYETYYGYTFSYQRYQGKRFNTSSKVRVYGAQVNFADNGNSKPTGEAIVKQLKPQGYKELVSGPSGCLLAKGDEVAGVWWGEQKLSVIFAKKNDTLLIDGLKESVKCNFAESSSIEYDSDSSVVVEEAVVEADSCVVDASYY